MQAKRCLDALRHSRHHFGRDPSSSSRCAVHAKWSVSSTQARVKWAQSAGFLVEKASAVYKAWAHTSPTWLTRARGGLLQCDTPCCRCVCRWQ